MSTDETEALRAGAHAVRALCADAMRLPTLADPRSADDRISPRAVLAALDGNRAALLSEYAARQRAAAIDLVISAFALSAHERGGVSIITTMVEAVLALYALGVPLDETREVIAGIGGGGPRAMEPVFTQAAAQIARGDAVARQG